MAPSHRDRVLNTSLGNLLIGSLLAAGIGAALVIATAKAGISPGVSPLVVLLGWVTLYRTGPRLHGTLAILQVTGSAGAAVSAGVIFTAPIVQVYAAQIGQPVPPVDIAQVMTASLSGILLGWGFVGLATPRFLRDPRLPAPEAVACDRLINTAADRPDERPNVWTSLVVGLATGAIVSALERFKLLAEKAGEIVVPLPRLVDEAFKLPLPASPLLLGIGALLTLPTALLIFGGALINAITTGYSAQHGLDENTYRWVGGAAMTVAVLWSLFQYVRDGLVERRRRANAATPVDTAEASLLEIPRSRQRQLFAAILVGAVLFFVMLTRAANEVLGDHANALTIITIGIVALLLVSVLSGLGALLSLQVGASASPVSGTVFMAMLVLALTALALSLTGSAAVMFLTPALVATCVAICAANDSSQDYKTLQLNGYPVHRGFSPQLIGLTAGAIVVPIVLAFGTGDARLGDHDYPCAQASFFGTALASLFEPDRPIPRNPVLVGAILGCLAIVLERIGKRFGLLLSPLALAVGIYLPSTMGVGILLGALARFAASRHVRQAPHSGILSAAGLISGFALLSLIVGLAVTVGADVSALEAKEEWSTSVSCVALAAIVGVLVFNYWPRNTRSGH